VSPEEPTRPEDAQPGASTSYDRIADQYEAVRGGDARARPLAAALARWIEPGSSVLDVGAETGIVTAALESSKYEVCGIDLSRPMLARAAGLLRRRFTVPGLIDGFFASTDSTSQAWSRGQGDRSGPRYGPCFSAIPPCSFSP